MSRTNTSYWRSLEQLRGQAPREALGREFVEGAADPPEGITRRTMLTLLGASLSMAGLAGCRRPVEEIVPFVDAPEKVIPGVPRYFATTMPFGSEAFGLVVESHEGRPTKIEGNERHPASRGATTARIQAELLNLYDPDRGRSPRLGAESRSWEQFVAAWAEMEPAHLQSGGAGLAVLSESFSSPTLSRLQKSFLERFPRARWVTYEAVSDENVHRAVAELTGQPYRPTYHFDRARVILSLDCDFLATESDALRHAREFASGRRIRRPGDSMNRLYVAEAAHSLTGAAADHRLPLAPSRIAGFVAALAAGLRDRGVAIDLPADLRVSKELGGAWLDALVADLAEAHGAGLIVAGRGQPPAVHAAVLGLNAALGNLGVTVGYRELPDATFPDRSQLLELVDAMRSGAVSTLLMIGGNPAYDAPVDVEFGAALEQVETVIRTSLHDDESAPADGWWIPEAHFLEAWGDARASDGSLSVVQPLIRPLFDGKSRVELIGLIATGEDRPGYDRVRETWQAQLPQTDFERAWFQLLHDGILGRSAVAESLPTISSDPFAGLAALPEVQGTEVAFLPSPALHDGRYANNGWLQELPDNLTKLTWDNAALISPATASGLGVASEEMLRLDYRGRRLELPAWVVPGMADDCVVLHLGYGRRRAGRVGTGRGFDTFALRTSLAPDFDGGLRVERGEGRYLLAQTQDHGSMEGRPIVREATLAQFRQDPGFAKEVVKLPVHKSMWTEHSYDESPQWGMSIDLNACNGCNACVIACQSENNVPIVGKEQVREGREMHWLRVDRYFAGESEQADVEAVFQPVPCMHCENAPCEQVCPVAATVHDEQGLNAMVYNRCIGTRYCSNNCPYKVRRFNFFNFTKDTPEVVSLAHNPDVTVRSRGVMEKCSYCTQRIEAARIEAKLDGRPLADGDVRTACEQACPTNAIVFGDITDPDSRVSRRKAEDRDYVLLEELYTKPRTTYLAKLRNPNPRLQGEGEV